MMTPDSLLMGLVSPVTGVGEWVLALASRSLFDLCVITAFLFSLFPIHITGFKYRQLLKWILPFFLLFYFVSPQQFCHPFISMEKESTLHVFCIYKHTAVRKRSTFNILNKWISLTAGFAAQWKVMNPTSLMALITVTHFSFPLWGQKGQIFLMIVILKVLLWLDINISLHSFLTAYIIPKSFN